ncbi:nidogen-1-like isoform X2 [Dysidea avara]|uniref:nidogen-1-like isoform X2 n=1 Tax=Dysidea avara TaxID=196820 RepID=UPI00332C0C47
MNLIVIASSLLLFEVTAAVPIDMFYNFGLFHGDKALPKGFMERSERIRLKGGFKFLGDRIYNIWVTTDGYLALDHFTDQFASEINPFPSPTDGSLIAPFLADIDTSGVGNIYYRHITDADDPTLKAINDDVNNANFKEFNNASFKANMAVIATWNQVGYFHGHSDKNNTFQVVLATDDVNATIAIFHYLDNGLNWYQFDADYYDDYSDDDLSDSQVQVGFNKGGMSGGSVPSLMAYTLSPKVIELDKGSNTKILGQWIFSIGDDNITEPVNVVCGKSVQKCLRKGKCKKRLRQFRESCNYLWEEDSSVCSSSCKRSVRRLINNKQGKNLWYCTYHFGFWNKLRNTFNDKC